MQVCPFCPAELGTYHFLSCSIGYVVRWREVTLGDLENESCGCNSVLVTTINEHDQDKCGIVVGSLGEESG